MVVFLHILRLSVVVIGVIAATTMARSTKPKHSMREVKYVQLVNQLFCEPFLTKQYIVQQYILHCSHKKIKTMVNDDSKIT